MKKTDLEALKSSLRIEEVVGGYVRLQRRGRHYVGLCPFHGDKHPSLMVNPARQTFSCFACKEWGDVFGFVQRMEHCTFVEAVEKLKIENGRLNIENSKRQAVVTGVPEMPEVSPVGDSPGGSDVNKFSNFNSQVSIRERNAKFLSLLLPFASGHSELSAAYLDFEVGVAPVQVPKEWYAFHNRLIFPIRDGEGLLVGFAGRRLTDGETEEAKYMNSSAEAGYKKSEVLYGLHRAKESIRRHDAVFITEGYKDVIAMHAAGIRNTVALCGTALSPFQIGLLKEYTSRVYLLLDGDRAGQEASRRLMPVLVTAGMETEHVELPEGEDPDSLFRKWGREGLAAMLRRLLTRPHSAESGLLTYCLLYPEAMMPFKGEICRFTELLGVVLNSDHLLFEDGDHRLILDHLAGGGREETLPPALRRVAEELHAGFDRQIIRDESILEEIMPEAANRREIYQSKLLFLYCETALLRDIRRQVRRLLRLPSKATEERTRLLIYISCRRELLRHVSECLGRPGAVVITFGLIQK